MPRSRKRQNHPYQKPSDVPPKQRTRGRTIWALLMATFGVLIAIFASNGGYAAMLIGAIIGAVLGYIIGKNMEREATK